MLANPNVPWQLPVSQTLRLVIAACFLGGITAWIFFAEGSSPGASKPPRPEATVSVPQLDAQIMAQIEDDSRQQRLLLEPGPFQHLLDKALDVSPAAALALGRPDEPVPLAELRKQRDEYRGEWLWYKGVLEELSGPREGHPVRGFSIYEATIRLPDGDRAIGAFSLAPGDDVKRGGFVRIEGYLLKLRDTTYPQDITEAPMLVGRRILRDYADWGPVTGFDPALLADIDDRYDVPPPGSKAWHDVEEDQDVPLWHLAAYVRDTDPAHSFEDWRQRPVLTAPNFHKKLVAHEVERGTRIRVLGTLVKRRAIVAAPNPAGITHWTVAYVQCRDFGGHIIAVWVPDRVLDVPLKTDLEVRGYYYRWYAYESIEDMNLRTPLFIASDLHVYDLKANQTMGTIGTAVGIALLLLMALIVTAQWRSRRLSAQHARQMDERRRRRRERATATATATPSS